MKEYKNFNLELKKLLKEGPSNLNFQWREKALHSVNGMASDELRKLINIKIRRDSGAFFTSQELAQRVAGKFSKKFNFDSFVYDPACGAGNLLIEASNFFPSEINEEIETHLLGTDIHEEFIISAKLRLQINKILRSGIDLQRNKKSFDFKYILKRDGLQNNSFYEMATHIVTNPPYQLVHSEEDAGWARGKVSAAAIFMDKITSYCQENVEIVAILPDVLRSGSRYEKWRMMIEERCSVDNIELLGQFDKYTDVDVFSLVLTKRKKSKINFSQDSLWSKTVLRGNTLMSDLCEICVGPVVDNRDPHEGESRGYLISKGLLGWEIKEKVENKRKYSGKSFISPFIVIKRTSRMGDAFRAVATIINSPTPIYVDNHLIVVKPKSGSIRDCYKVLSSLKDIRTNEWLNQEIRCRHLTIKALSRLPLWT